MRFLAPPGEWREARLGRVSAGTATLTATGRSVGVLQGLLREAQRARKSVWLEWN